MARLHPVQLAEMSAIISSDEKYRYYLARDLRGAKSPAMRHTVCFIMLNPSTADATQDDPTIRRCIGFARRFGYNALSVVNLFAYRATNPRMLLDLQPEVAIGPDNDRHIAEAVCGAHGVICAWGNRGALYDRGAIVADLIRAQCIDPECLGLTKTGQPAHPLYLSNTLLIRPMP